MVELYAYRFIPNNMLLYSIDWKQVPIDEFLRMHGLPTQKQRRRQQKSRRRDPILDNPNVIAVRVTGLDERGETQSLTKLYEDWLGVHTDDIEAVTREIKTYLPGIGLRCVKLNESTYMNVLPYFPERLRKGQLDYESRPFYKLYADSPVEDVGRFFRRYDIAYYQKSDWLARLYIDLCTNHRAGFYYKWYRVDRDCPMLLDALRMVDEDECDAPNWRTVAFDIETVPGPDAPVDRVPDGSDPGDRVVMISVVAWDERGSVDEKVLYLNPTDEKLNLGDPKYLEYDSESDLLNDFHFLIRNCHVLTGYNVNNFDLPCIFARLIFLRRFDLLSGYSSRMVGDYRIVTYRNKIVLDLYPYFRIFSNYDLSSFKLDEVAKTKLKDDRKIAVDSVGIHAWYNCAGVKAELCRSADAKFCHEKLQESCGDRRLPPANRFGTFPEYVEYCLRDSQLVRKLFQKETTLSFLIARSHFAALDVVQSMHYGNSRFLLEVFRTYGTMLGYFINVEFFENTTDCKKLSPLFEKGTYQGALNYCLPETYFEDVAVLDFTSMYPISLLSTNLCYGTCDILTAEEYKILDDGLKRRLTAIPYRTHSDLDFKEDDHPTYHHLVSGRHEFRYPTFDPERDAFVIVVDQTVQGFLPTVVKHFFDLRQHHQREWKRTRNVVHYNSQLCIKLLINSMYGTMASKDSPLAYIVVAMAIVTLARYQLLGSYHYVQDVLGHRVCYADTDSLMVHRWPRDDCDEVNRFLGTLPYVELKFEQRMRRLLVLSKKRYVYERAEDGKIVSKGFQKKINDLVKYMSDAFIKAVMDLKGTRGDPNEGWCVWVETLSKALYMCRDPRQYAVTRKTRKLSEYISTTCTAVKILKKYPEREGDYIDYAFSRADVAEEAASDWVMDVVDCQYVNFEKLFVNQKKIFITILNVGFWNLDDPVKPCDAVLNTIRWKYFVNAELLHRLKTGKKIAMLVERGVRYTFHMNEHCFKNKKRIKRNKLGTPRKRTKA